MTLLSVENLSVTLKTVRGPALAVRNLSFDLKRGKTLGIVGESGCGKSLTALAIMGLLPENGWANGRVTLGGENLLDYSEDEMCHVRGDRIGMVFQEPMTSLNPVLSVGRQLTETLETHFGMSREDADKRAIELLGLVGIAEPERRLAQYPHHFSGGMRQRVMIAMALACDPKLIIADEPTTALDVTIQAQILELMKNLTREMGVAMIIITHNLGVVARYADRVNVMYAGKIVESGTAKEIYHNPRHPYTLALLKSVPRLDLPRGAKLDPVDGQPPDLARLDDGCPFRPRCRFAQDGCANDVPPLAEVREKHWSACFEQDAVEKSLETA